MNSLRNKMTGTKTKGKSPLKGVEAKKVNAKRMRDLKDQRQEFTSSSEDEDDVPRPHKDEHIPMTKKAFLQMVEINKLPIGQDTQQLELMYRFIDLSNALMKEKAKAGLEEQVGLMEEELKEKEKKEKDGPAFFKGNMSTTIMLNGVDQLVRYNSRKASWSQVIVNLFRGYGVMVMDMWVVKRQGTEVVSVLVKFASRFQKILAMGAVNDRRAELNQELPRQAKVRVNARDAFPKEQIEAVQECYNRGYQMKKSGRITAYRIHNTGGSMPTFEVRKLVDGQQVWGPAPPSTGETPERSRRGRSSRSTSQMRKSDSDTEMQTEGTSSSQVEGQEQKKAAGGSL